MDLTARHPLADFDYCPHCGRMHPQPYDHKAIRCSACGFVYYANASAAVACLVVDRQRRLLVVCRAADPYAGTLDLPGGFVDPGECIEDAASREVMEETGLCIRHWRYLFSLPNIYPFCGHEVHTTDLFLVAQVADTDVAQAGDDAAEILCLPFGELVADQFGLPSMRIAIARIIADPSILMLHR